MACWTYTRFCSRCKEYKKVYGKCSKVCIDCVNSNTNAVQNSEVK